MFKVRHLNPTMNNEKFSEYVKQCYSDLQMLEKHLSTSDREKLTITEKLAFLRNVEALHRSDEARKRTWLAMIAVIMGLGGLLFLVLRLSITIS